MGAHRTFARLLVGLAATLAGCTGSGGPSATAADAGSPAADTGTGFERGELRPCPSDVIACFGEGHAGAAYFTVDVRISEAAPREFLDRIAVCGAAVLDSDGNIIAQEPLRCAKCTIQTHRLGRFDWATDQKVGEVRFVVAVNTLANDPGRPLGRGVSGAFTVRPGTEIRGVVEVTPSADWQAIGAGSAPCPP